LPDTEKDQRPTGEVFDEISSYWTEIADALDTEKQVNFVKNNLSSSGLVLDLGCGSGRHAIQLGKAGYETVGLDVSPRLLRIAKLNSIKANLNLTLVRADMSFLPFRTKVFSAIISLDSTFGYFPSKNEDLRSLREADRTLADEGVFLLDVFNGERMLLRTGRFRVRDLFYGLARFPQFSALFRWLDYPSFYMLQKRRVGKNNGILRDIWVFRDKKTGKTLVVRHAIRLYTLALLQRLLAESKLKLTKVFGDYEKEAFTKDSRRLIITAVKA
jgi:SAM-dependent methyltransferase